MVKNSGNGQYQELSWTEKNVVKYALLIVILLAFVTGCEQRPVGTSSGNVSASWDEESSILVISGTREASEENVLIHDASNGTLLGSAIVKDDGSWSASSTNIACDVHVELPSGTATIAVNNAPENCGASASTISSRVVAENDIPVDVLVVANPQPLNTVPNAVILSPPQDININVGQSVNFSGTILGGSVAPPFTYYWNFGGAAPNSTIQNPGPIRFDIPGTFFIQLTVTDNLGIPDPTPAVRTITVGSSSFPNQGNTPVPTISSPVSVNGSISISAGESLFFTGSATDQFGSTSFTYEWDFSGAYPNQFGATAGSISFTQQGTYVVSLYATNAQGIRSVTPATVTVIVGGSAGGFNQSPSGSIVRPRNDVTIDIGDSLTFRARATDPDNNTPLYYSWDFQGVAPNINMSSDNSAGRVTFNTPGVYYIRMTTTDALGAMDPNPPVRMVTVQNSVTNPPPGGGNGTLATQITSPPSDITISPGQSLFFSGQSTSNAVAQYFWSFDGAAANSNLQSPGNITFPLPGQFIVMFYAVDFSGNVVGTPSTRIITVSDPSNVAANITSPVDGSTVLVGQPMNLIGNTSNNTGFTNLSYSWTIKPRGGGASIFSSNQLMPGSYIFTQAGEFVVRFKVKGIDQFGNPTVASKSKARVTVTNAGNIPPPIGSPAPGVANAGIMLPATDMVIYTGNEVDFEANRFSGTNIRYNWDFNGVRNSSTRRNPSAVTFNTPGTFFITLQVTGTSNGIPLNIFDQRVITVMQQNPSFPPTNPVVQNTGILLPVTDQVINIGQSVDFEANRISGTNVNYRWDFSGAAAPSDRRNPRPIQFNSPGTFFVTLQVTGTSNGLPINIFDQRVITVMQGVGGFPPANPFPNPVAQNVGIDLPTTDQVINLGQSVDFKANRFSGTNIRYSWDFGGASSPSTRRNPSPIQFNSPGAFFITLQVTGTDNNGIPINVFDQRTVTVLQSGAGLPGNNPIQQGPGISMPITDSVINVGETVHFHANTIDGSNVNYSWNFNGVRSNSSRRNPGDVQFNTPGSFFITLQVTGTATNGLPINIFDQRVITVLQSAAGFPPINNPIPPQAPVAFGSSISSPATDMVINVGDQVDFGANRVSGTNIVYNWDFSGVRSPSTRRNPNNVTFNNPGTFFITLQVTGAANGLPINLFDQRVITVLQPNLPFPPAPSPFPGQTPVGATPGMLSPITDAVINIGDSVDFEAVRFRGGNANYSWDFNGVRRSSSRRNPSPVQFNNPGSFLITVQITGSDANGLPISIFDQRAVTVLQSVAGFPPVNNPIPTQPPGGIPGAAGSGPEGYITAPTAQFVTVRAGESVRFSGVGFDPLGNGQLSFQWSFGGATRNISSQDPGFITFDRVGTYVVTLLVTNSFGQADVTPPSVLVQVTP